MEHNNYKSKKNGLERGVLIEILPRNLDKNDYENIFNIFNLRIDKNSLEKKNDHYIHFNKTSINVEGKLTIQFVAELYNLENLYINNFNDIKETAELYTKSIPKKTIQ